MKRIGQSTLEYAVFTCLIVAALLSMTTYFKRGIQGKMREGAEQISDSIAYSPKATLGNYNMTRSIKETLSAGSEERKNGQGNSFGNAVTVHITETNMAMEQNVTKTEEVLTFASEPAR